jgi:hypothetical protein
MASGEFYLGTSGNIEGKITWESTPNVSTNKSVVKVQIWCRKISTSTSATTGTWKGHVNVAGVVKDFSYYDSIGNSYISMEFEDGSAFASGTKAHNNDGTGSCYIYGEINGPSGTSQAGSHVSGSKTVTLDNIPRAGELTSAPNFTDEDNPKITYKNPAGSSAVVSACISLDGETDIIAFRNVPATGTSYTFNLTTAERNVLRNACKDVNSTSVLFVFRTTIGSNVYYSALEKTLTIINANPTINPTITDVDTSTTALTGDSNKVVRYFSDLQYSAGASALKGATIKTLTVTCGSETKTTATGTFTDVETNKIKFTVIDSRGNSTTKTVEKTLIPYVKLTCNIGNNTPDTQGNFAFTVKGNYFNSTFGTVANTLNVFYMWKSDGEFSDWIAMTATKSGNSYTAVVNLTGLDYQKTYTFQAYAVDKLTAAATDEKPIKASPVFDWSGEDFNFNVHVNLKNNMKISGISTDNRELNAFQPCNGNNNCVIGYGAYTEGIGATNLYGNDVNILTNTGLTVNDGSSVYSILGAMRAMSAVYELDCTVTAGSGYSDCSATAFLIGNNLRMYMSATRSANANTGDVANETVMTITVKHNGKIKSLYGTGLASATTGAPATFHSAAEKIDDNNHKITISLCGVSVADNGWSGYWCLPCTLDLTKY